MLMYLKSHNKLSLFYLSFNVITDIGAIHNYIAFKLK